MNSLIAGLACGKNRVLDCKPAHTVKMVDLDWNPQESNTSSETWNCNDTFGTGSPLIQSRPKVALPLTVSIEMQEEDPYSSSPRHTRMAGKITARPEPPRRSKSLLALLSPRRRVDPEVMRSRLEERNGPLRVESELPETTVDIALIKTGDMSRQLLYGSGLDRGGGAGFGSRIRRRLSNNESSESETKNTEDKPLASETGLSSDRDDGCDDLTPVLVETKPIPSAVPDRASLNRSPSVLFGRKRSSAMQRSKSTRTFGVSRFESSPVKICKGQATEDIHVGVGSSSPPFGVPKLDCRNATLKPAIEEAAPPSSTMATEPAMQRRHSISYQENCHMDPSVGRTNATRTQDLLEAYEKIIRLNDESDTEEDSNPSYLPVQHQVMPSKGDRVRLVNKKCNNNDSPPSPTSSCEIAVPPPPLERELSLMEPTGWE